jgi:ligand-binding sensor domain-containing protein
MVMRSWQTEEGLPQNTVNAIAQTRDGFLWIGTSGGLARFDGVRFRKFGLQDGLLSVRISALLEDKSGSLWIGTTGGGLSRRDADRFTSFGSAEGFPSGADVISMIAGSDGSLWIGTSKGLVKWSHGSFSVIGESQGLPAEQVRAVAEDAEGTLWVSVLEKGIFRGTNGQFARMEVPELNPTYSLLADRDGAIWAGGGNGNLGRWSNGKWQLFGSTNGLPLASFIAFAQGGDGTLWVCAGNRGLYRLWDEHFVQVANSGEFAGRNARAILVDPEGSIWVGTPVDGLHRFSRRVLQYWRADVAPGSGTFGSIAEDPSGTWWLAAGSSGVFRFANGHFSTVEDPAVSVKSHHIYCTTSSGDGSIWAAGEQCLYRFHADQPTQAFLDRPVSGEAIRAMCADGRHAVARHLLLDFDEVGRCGCAGRCSPRIIRRRHHEHRERRFGFALDRHLRRLAPLGTRKDCSNLGYSRRSSHREYARITPRFRRHALDWHVRRGARATEGRRICNITTRHGLTDDIISQIVADDHGHLNLGTNRGIMRIARSELNALADGKISEVHPVALGKNEGMLKEQCAGGYSPTAIKTGDGRLLFPTASGIAEIDPRRLEAAVAHGPRAVVDRVLVDGQPRPVSAKLLIPPGDHRLEVHYAAPALNRGIGSGFATSSKD